MKPDSKRTAPLDFRRVTNLIRTLLSQAGVDRSYAKVFAIGFNKTGTSSINSVFASTGLGSLHSTRWNKPGQARLLYLHQAFSDGSEIDFASLDRRFPRSKFILNVRDLDEWLDSRIEHIRHTSEIGIHSDTGNWAISDAAVTSWIRQRNVHHLAILDYFADRPADLLVVNFIRADDSAARIRSFLGRPGSDNKPHTRPIPVTRFAGILRNPDMIANCLSRLGIPQPEWKTDIYCPSLESANIGAKWPSDTARMPKAAA